MLPGSDASAGRIIELKPSPFRQRDNSDIDPENQFLNQDTNRTGAISNPANPQIVRTAIS